MELVSRFTGLFSGGMAVLAVLVVLCLIRAAMKKVEKDGVEVTDDCSAVEYLGMTVKLVEGDERNLKVTTPLDLKIAEMLLEEEK